MPPPSGMVQNQSQIIPRHCDNVLLCCLPKNTHISPTVCGGAHGFGTGNPGIFVDVGSIVYPIDFFELVAAHRAYPEICIKKTRSRSIFWTFIFDREIKFVSSKKLDNFPRRGSDLKKFPENHEKLLLKFNFFQKFPFSKNL